MADRMVHSIRRGDVDSVVQHITDGGDANGTDHDGLTPLMHAARLQPESPAVVSALLSNGADVGLCDRVRGFTALHFAAEGHSPSVVKILLDAGESVDAEDLRGNTALLTCLLSSRRSRGTFQALIAGGADQKKGNRFGVTPAEVLADIDSDAWSSVR